MMITTPYRAALMALAFIPTIAHAQTPVDGTRRMPPVPQKNIDQAKRQANGDFGSMSRGNVGGQIQEAWNNSSYEEGVVTFNICLKCIYKVRLRQHMVTYFELPEGEIIRFMDGGDNKEFLVEKRGPNSFSVKPAGFGVDANLIIKGTSGNVYPIYLRSENTNSNNIPDQFVEIKGRVHIPDGNTDGIEHKADWADSSQGPDELAATMPPLEVGKSSAGPHPYEDLPPGWKAPDDNDFVKQIPFEPDKLRGWGHYEMWGGGPHVKELRKAIDTVFKDDYMTFIRFNEKLAEVELPTAYVVVDGIDELVNTRIDGNTYIIESTHKLITLKSGQTYLCIKYTGAL